MPLFYFDVYDGVSGLDRVGKHCLDQEAAGQEAARQAEGLLAQEGDWFRTGQEWQIGVIDSKGAVIFHVSFGASADAADSVDTPEASYPPRWKEQPSSFMSA